jgi:hypothetical protein
MGGSIPEQGRGGKGRQVEARKKARYYGGKGEEARRYLYSLLTSVSERTSPTPYAAEPPSFSTSFLTFCIVSSCLPVMKTLAPLLPSSEQTAAPIPLLPPVTMHLMPPGTLMAYVVSDVKSANKKTRKKTLDCIHFPYETEFDLVIEDDQKGPPQSDSV